MPDPPVRSPEAGARRVIAARTHCPGAAGTPLAAASSRLAAVDPLPLPEHWQGRGRSFASFGEIAQGRRTDGTDFLLTLPVALYSTCELTCIPWRGPSLVQGALPKSLAVAHALLRDLGLTRGVRVQLRCRRGMPIGKGLSSSTADMLAVVRAFQDAFGIRLGEDGVSRLFAAIEPHDGLHFDGCVAYDHRRGRLLARLGHVPRWQIVGVDAGGVVSTEAYNRHLTFPAALLVDYDRLYDAVLDAFARRDDQAIARCALRSARLHARRTGNRFLAGLLAAADWPGVRGLVATHSGTCAGLLVDPDAGAAAVARVARLAAAHGRVFHTRTLSAGR